MVFQGDDRIKSEILPQKKSPVLIQSPTAK